MNNFTFKCPTKVVFGKNSVEQLPTLLPKDAKILLFYGGGSIKRNGVYDAVIKELKGHKFVEFSGIEPNPKYETCMQAVKLIKDENVDFILSVGGGSALDAAKFIAAAAVLEAGDPWEEIIIKAKPITKTLPVGDVITLPATGSEMNGISVISHKEKGLKFAWSSELAYPVFSIIDPTYTFSLPQRQTTNGIVDTFAHIMEQYCTYDVDTPVQDGFCLSVIKTIVKEGPKVLANPQDYNARANIFWAATCGLNGWCGVGVVQDWASHGIGHELSAIYGLDHGQSLAVVLPAVLEYCVKEKAQKLALLGREVFALEGDELDVAKRTVDKIKEFFLSIEAQIKLSDFGVDKNDAAKQISERFKERGTVLGERANIDAKATKEILLSC
ncbi:iron-containing alcohol dehydrogenase [Campylobacter geochelonis]|uniref:iron-containing alcohol dehydrogenase n=1 Tax=Campylobacter geochelonis TaxID=1780362 RepID=UPI000770A423|nr:iron-containing alcohol dehydrogenase [Campylobacter geochelonis]CZE48355.1 iron-containing alcohol dehydrogenase [Campylobacter geochelonis]